MDVTLKPTIPNFKEIEREIIVNHIKENTDKQVTKTLIEEVYKRGVQDGYIYAKSI
jgi:hypothetical protein